jgi:hypothetical protein
MRKIVCPLAGLLALACVSCGGESLHPVAGKVTYNGVPAVGATVFFQRQGAVSDQVIMGSVRADGSFELVCGASGNGAPAGTYDVLIVWRSAGNDGKEVKGCCERKTDRLHGHYADPGNPRFHATVQPGGAKLPPFEITDQ